MLEGIVIPDLHFPVEPALSPYTEAVQREINQWMQEHEYLKTEKALKRFQAGKFAWTTGRAHPEAGFDQIRIVATYMSWLFMVDDWCDEESLGKDPDGLAALHSQLIYHMRHPRPAMPNDSPVIVGLIDVWQEMRQNASPEWVTRFIETFTHYAEGCVWEARNRAQGSIPSLDEYVIWRRQTSALYIFFDLIELADDVTLPEAVLNHEALRELKKMANDGVAWFNDIVSLEKEIRTGDIHNLVIVLQHEDNLDLQTAIDRAAAIFNARMRAYFAQEREIPSFGPTLDKEIKRYIAGLRAWIRGNIDWSYETGRYGQARREAEPER